MRRLLPACLLLLAVPLRAASLFPDSPFTDAALGTTGAAFLKIPVGARTSALGTSGASLRGEADDVFWNPAGLAWVDRRELELSYGRLLETSYLGSVSYAIPSGPGTWGFGLRYFSQSPLDAFNSIGDKTGTFRPYDLSIGVAYARQGPRFAYGIGVKLLRSSLDDRSGTGLALDAGMLAKDVSVLGDGPVDVGIAIRNLGPPLKMGGRSDPLPFEATFGMHWHAKSYLRVLADMRLPVDQKPYLTVGAEAHGATGGFDGALRIGYIVKDQTTIPGLSGLTAGGGLSFESFGMDYAWVAFGDLGQTHRVTLTFPFGSRLHRSVPAPAVEEAAPKPHLAVMRLEAKGLESSWAAAASEFLTDALLRGRRFKVLRRADVVKGLRLVGIKDSACGDTVCARVAGNALRMQKVIVGSLTYLGGTYTLQIQLVDAWTGEVDFSGSEQARQPALIRQAARTLAARMEKFLTAQGRP